MSPPNVSQGMDASAAERLLHKLRTVVAEELDDEERALFAALLAPGIDLAYQAQTEDEVAGFGIDWSMRRLPDSLAAAIRERHLRIEGW